MGATQNHWVLDKSTMYLMSSIVKPDQITNSFVAWTPLLGPVLSETKQ